MKTTDLEIMLYSLIEEYVESQPNGLTNENLQWVADVIHQTVELTIEDYAHDQGIEYESVY